MDEITFQVSRSEDSGWLVAWWDDPNGGGITTQARDLRDLQEQVIDATQCHFEPNELPRQIRLPFVDDAVLIPA